MEEIRFIHHSCVPEQGQELDLDNSCVSFSVQDIVWFCDCQLFQFLTSDFADFV